MMSAHAGRTRRSVASPSGGYGRPRAAARNAWTIRGGASLVTTEALPNADTNGATSDISCWPDARSTTTPAVMFGTRERRGRAGAAAIRLCCA